MSAVPLWIIREAALAADDLDLPVDVVIEELLYLQFLLITDSTSAAAGDAAPAPWSPAALRDFVATLGGRSLADVVTPYGDAYDYHPGDDEGSGPGEYDIADEYDGADELGEWTTIADPEGRCREAVRHLSLRRKPAVRLDSSQDIRTLERNLVIGVAQVISPATEFEGLGDHLGRQLFALAPSLFGRITPD